MTPHLTPRDHFPWKQASTIRARTNLGSDPSPAPSLDGTDDMLAKDALRAMLTVETRDATGGFRRAKNWDRGKAGPKNGWRTGE